jgi:predicted dehydrogenase
MDVKPLLIVGFGPRGRRWREVIERSRRASVAGISDIDGRALDDAGSAGIPAFDSLEDAIREVRPAGAIIATPPHLHSAHAAALAKEGVPVLVEKPLSTNLEEAVVIAEAARPERPVLAGQNFRYLRREVAVRRCIAEIGTVRSVDIRSARTADSAPTHIGALRHGPIWDFCSHHFDAVLDRFQLEAIAVSAEDRSAGRPTLYSLNVELAGGVTVNYQHAEGARAYSYAERITGETGAILVEHQKVQIERSGGRTSTVGWGHLLPDRFSRSPDRAVLGQFLVAIDGTPVPLDAKTNLPAIALMEGIDRALDTGGRAEVKRVGMIAS